MLIVAVLLLVPAELLKAQSPKGIKAIWRMHGSNFQPGRNISLDITFQNEGDRPAALTAQVEILNEKGEKVWDNRLNFELKPLQEFKIPLMVPAPKAEGDYRLTLNNEQQLFTGLPPAEPIRVIEPEKSERLGKIMVTVPEWESQLHGFVEKWELEAPSISWGQVVLCGSQTWQRFSNGDKETAQLLDRALRRGMSVLFLDFGPKALTGGAELNVKLPFGAGTQFYPTSDSISSAVIVSANKEMNFNIENPSVPSFNGMGGAVFPVLGMKIDPAGLALNPYLAAGTSNAQYPVVELKPKNGLGKLILCRLITDGRLDESRKNVRNRPDLPFYDPLAEQLILNLISASVGEELMK